MFRLFAILVRTNYLIAVVVALLFLVPWLSEGLLSLFRPTFLANDIPWQLCLWLGALACLIAPAMRALLRLVRRAELIPDGRIREAPIVSTWVLFASFSANFLFLNLAWAFLTRAGRDVELAPFGFFGLFWLAISLLTAEIALVGRLIDATADRPDAAGIVIK